MDKAEWIKRFVEAWERTDPDPEDVNPDLVAEYAERVWPKRGHEDPRVVGPVKERSMPEISTGHHQLKRPAGGHVARGESLDAPDDLGRHST